MASMAVETFITNKNLYSVLPAKPGPNIRVVLGILNSRLLSFLYVNRVSQADKDDFPQVTIEDLAALPFPDEARQKEQRVRLASLVRKMLSLHARLQKLSVPLEKGAIEQQIEDTDKAIDALVYEMYGLTDDEIAAVEDRSK